MSIGASAALYGISSATKTTKKRKAKMAKKRVHKATTTRELIELIERCDELEFRPRVSSDNLDWDEVTDDHLINCEKFNYQELDNIRPRIVDGRVEMEGEGISIGDAKRLVQAARLARRSKKERTVEIMGFGDVPVYENGNIAIGCQQIDWDVVQAFAKKHKW